MVFPTELNLTMIDTNDFERLRRIGLTPALMPAVMTAMTTVALAGAEPTLMRVTEVLPAAQGGNRVTETVYNADGSVHQVKRAVGELEDDFNLGPGLGER